MNKKIEEILNIQIQAEAVSSQLYLAMASWADTQGLTGISEFLYSQSDEERQHMLKLIKYVNERGGQALIPAMKQQPQKFKSIHYVCEEVLKHEVFVSNEIMRNSSKKVDPFRQSEILTNEFQGSSTSPSW